MSTKDKLLERFKSLPPDFTFDELTRLLSFWGFRLDHRGVTSGSRVSFVKGNERIKFHRPHPGNIMKKATLKDIYNLLKIKGLI